MSKYMDHDLFRVSGLPDYYSNNEPYICRRCGAKVRYFTYCGTRETETWWDSDGKIVKTFIEPKCVARDE